MMGATDRNMLVRELPVQAILYPLSSLSTGHFHFCDPLAVADSPGRGA